MITWLLVWPAVAYAVALVLSRVLRGADELPAPEPDWLWDQPTDALSDAAVDARFAEIKAHFSVTR